MGDNYSPAMRGAELALEEARRGMQSAVHAGNIHYNVAGDDPDGVKLSKRIEVHVRKIEEAVSQWRVALEHVRQVRKKRAGVGAAE